ncbi:3'-5' exonuclease, partial [Rhizobium ruizarguesonis]
KELIRSMESFESMRGFLEHFSLVMDAETNENLDSVSIMTLHSAKGLEFDTVFLLQAGEAALIQRELVREESFLPAGKE